MRLGKYSQHDGVGRLTFSSWWTMGRRKDGRQWSGEVRTPPLNYQAKVPSFIYLFLGQLKDRKQM